MYKERWRDRTMKAQRWWVYSGRLRDRTFGMRKKRNKNKKLKQIEIYKIRRLLGKTKSTHVCGLQDDAVNQSINQSFKPTNTSVPQARTDGRTDPNVKYILRSPGVDVFL